MIRPQIQDQQHRLLRDGAARNPDKSLHMHRAGDFPNHRVPLVLSTALAARWLAASPINTRVPQVLLARSRRDAKFTVSPTMLWYRRWCQARLDRGTRGCWPEP